MMETVDATLTMLAKQPIPPEQIERIVVRIPESGARTVNNRRMPDVNVQYMVAAILLEGKLSFELAHDYGRFQNSRVLGLKEKVQLIGDAELERSGHRFQGLVEITLKDGRTVREHVINCRGRPENPMTPEEVENTDFPTRDDARFLSHSMVYYKDCKPVLEYKPVTITMWKPVERKY
jgi:2-methylcitrate dehydratase PrpD